MAMAMTTEGGSMVCLFRSFFTFFTNYIFCHGFLGSYHHFCHHYNNDATTWNDDNHYDDNIVGS